MHSLIYAMEPTGTGPTLAVKDLIDIEGTLTTAGSLAVASIASPATSDAPLLKGSRLADARIVGKANLYELAFGASGVNSHFGTPTNPLDESLVPGGSSSGSAVAVATGEAEVAFGSDTGGSIRVPAAFCAVAGLKTTHGRIPLAGVYPLAPSLDTVGPMARDVAGLVVGMELLEPGFSISSCARSVGLVRDCGVRIDPMIGRAIESACLSSGLRTAEISLISWMRAFEAGSTILHAEAVSSNRHLIEDPELFAMLSPAVRDRLAVGERITPEQLEEARSFGSIWRATLETAFEEVELLALPSVGFFPVPLTEAFDHTYTHLTTPVNLAGFPAVSIPVPTDGPLPASLQLVGPPNSEPTLLASAALFEQVVASESFMDRDRSARRQ